MPYVYRNLLTLISTLCFLSVFSQENVNLSPSKRLSQFPVKSWDMDNGLPSDMAVKLIQSNDGYIWLATYKGMTRFDGTRFTNFNHNSSQAIESVTIQDVITDSQGTLWFTSHKGIVAYKNHEFVKDSNLTMLNKENIETIFYDSTKNVLWIGTNSKGVYRYNYKQLEPMPQFMNITRSIVKVIKSDYQNNIWIGTEAGDIVKYREGIFTEIKTSEKVNEIGSFYPTKSGKIWVATSSGIYTIENDKLKKQNNINVTKTNSVIEDNHKTLWIGSQNGLFRYNLESGLLDSLNEKMGIPNNLIKDILADNEGNLWVATYRKGIFRLTDGLILNYSQNEGLSTDVITSITEINRSKFLAADEQGSINQIENGKISRLKTKTQIPRDRLKHILFDSKENLWISTYSGLIKIEKNGRELLYNPTTGFPSITVRLTYEDNQGNIWVGTRSDGLYRMRPNGSIDEFNHNNGLSSNYIMAVTQDRLGRIVVATKNGLNIIESNQVSKLINTDTGLPSNFAFNVHIDNQNVFWLSSNDGIIRIENDKDIFVYNIQNGLFDNTMFDILEDEYGYFWMPTDIGIVRMNKQELNQFAKGEIGSYSYRVFDRSDGMKNARCMGATKSIISSDGRMWFTTNGGVSVINPKDLAEKTNPARLVIENLVVNGKSLPPASSYTLPPGSIRIHVNYTAFFLKSPEKIKFRYRLIPFDQSWIDAGVEREARFTNISPGSYTFELMSTDPDGEWVNQTQTISIRIKTQWWKTLWFNLLAAAILALLLFVVYKLRTRSIKLQKLELERLVKERTTLIEQQKNEIELQSVEMEKLSIVASHTNNAILIASPQGEILWINEAYTRFYGYSFDELISIKGDNLLKICDDKSINYIIEKCIKNHEPTSYSLQVVTKFGKPIWIQTSLTPIMNADGKVRNLVAIDTDISELKQAELEMINMNDEIISQAEAILHQNEEIQTQRDELEQINTLLIRHTENIEASIWYAKTIQQAILPEKSTLDQFFENFIVYKPKDIVSGDFYWFTRIPGNSECTIRFFLAVIDCTGHGVPGALMSMIGSRLLSEIVTEKEVYSPAQILSQLNHQVIQALKQEAHESFDGMDVGLCLIEYTNNGIFNITFAGANRPLYFHKKGDDQIQIIRGNRKAIGGIMPDVDAEFVNQAVELKPNDALFLSTDGYTDQNNSDNVKLSVSKLHGLIIENINEPMAVIGEKLDVAFDEFRGLQTQRDDATILGIRLKDFIQ